MSVNDNQDWAKVERLAVQHESTHFLPVVKVPEPTQAQQLLWVTTDLAQAKARILRKDSAISTAIMWLSVNEPQRAQEALNKGLIDL